MVDWTGSNAAAWAQAILSGLAILYSGRLATNQSRRNKRDRVDTCVEILNIACQGSNGACAIAEAVVKLQGGVVSGSQAFAQTAESMRAIPFHEFPDYRLVAIIRLAAIHCDVLDRHFDSPVRNRVVMTHTDLAYILFSDKELNRLRAEAEQISNELMSVTDHFRVTAWKARTYLSSKVKLQHSNAPEDRGG